AFCSRAARDAGPFWQGSAAGTRPALRPRRLGRPSGPGRQRRPACCCDTLKGRVGVSDPPRAGDLGLWAEGDETDARKAQSKPTSLRRSDEQFRLSRCPTDWDAGVTRIAFSWPAHVWPPRLIVVMSALPEGTRPAARGTLPPSCNSRNYLPRLE